MRYRSLIVPSLLGAVVLMGGVPLAHARGYRDNQDQRGRDSERSRSVESGSRSSGGRLRETSSSSSGSSSTNRQYKGPSRLGGNGNGGYEGRRYSDGSRSIPTVNATNGGQPSTPTYTRVQRPNMNQRTNDPTLGQFEQRANEGRYNRRYQNPGNNGGGTPTAPVVTGGNTNTPPSLGQRYPNGGARHRNGNGSNYPVVTGSPYGSPVDSRHADGVTEYGRILGTNASVDRQGRTEIGQVLGNRSVAVEGRLGGDRIARDRFSRFHYSRPVYGYDPFSGRYESWHDGVSRNRIGVLLGTSAARPRYTFHHRGTHSYYYPYYCDNAVSVGFSVFPSLYFYYGYLPTYIPSTRVIVVDNPVIVHRNVYVNDDSDAVDDSDSYYLNRGGVEQDLDSALSDVRKAWLSGDIDLLLRRVRSGEDLPVYLKGKYVYSLPPDDYRDLTLDAMKNSTTTGFRWLGVDHRSDDEVKARAEHTFTDSDGEQRSVYVSFTFARINGAWWIAEVGSSNRAED